MAMRKVAGWLALAAGAAMGFPACAAPGTVPAKSEAETPLYVPFDPPVGQPIRYRWEKHQSKDGVPRISWRSADYVFAPREGGYRLTVTQVDSGSNASDPAIVAAEKKLAYLTDRPTRFLLDETGAVIEVEDVDAYWTAIIEAVEEALGAREGAKALTEEERKRLAEFVKLMRDISPAVRIGLLTESVQPATEFAETEMTPGETVQADTEDQSPFGGPIKRRASIQLKGLKDGIATYSIHLTVPPEELAKATTALIARLSAGEKPEELERAKAELAGMKLRHETTSRYEVDASTGLTIVFESTEIVKATGADGDNERITARSLRRID